jgi:CBS domain-containing protein
MKEKDYRMVTERDILYKVVVKDRNWMETRAKDIMSKELYTIEPQRDIRRACQLFTLYNIRRLAVVERGEIIGIVHSQDIARCTIFMYDEYLQFLEYANKEHATALKQNVKSIMREAIFTSPEVSVQDACVLMKEAKAGEVLVKVGEGRYGIATEKDILVKIGARALSSKDVMVGEIYTPVHTFIDSDKTVRDACLLFNIRSVRRLPVIESKEVIGIVTEKEMSKFCVFAFTTTLQALSDKA